MIETSRYVEISVTRDIEYREKNGRSEENERTTVRHREIQGQERATTRAKREMEIKKRNIERDKERWRET